MRMFILVFTLLLSLGLLDWGLRTAPAGVAEADEAPRAGTAPSTR